MSDASDAEVAGAAAPRGLAVALRRHLLLLRFALFNVVAFGLLAATWARGWLDGALAGETGLLCAVIAAVFCYGLALCALQIAAVNRALNQVRAGSPRADSHAAHYLAAVAGRAADTRMVQAGLLRLRIAHPAAVVRHIANALVFLGLVGTVIGFIVALSGVEPDLTASVDEVAPMVATLINGMSIALYTTLIGAVLHVWLMIGYRMLATGAVQLYDATLELGERRVRD